MSKVKIIKARWEPRSDPNLSDARKWLRDVANGAPDTGVIKDSGVLQNYARLLTSLIDSEMYEE